MYRQKNVSTDRHQTKQINVQTVSFEEASTPPEPGGAVGVEGWGGGGDDLGGPSEEKKRRRRTRRRRKERERE